MAVIDVSLRIAAPIERVFDLCRSVDLHTASTDQTGERAVGGVTSGLLELGDEVTWEAKHFGIRQRLTSRITRFERPTLFRDSMVKGAFSRFDHDHVFLALDDGATEARDIFDFDAPLGPLGRLASAVVLQGYMGRFLRARLDYVRSVAESEAWAQYLGNVSPPA